MSSCAPKDNGKKQPEVEVIPPPEVSIYKVTEISVYSYDERLAEYTATIANKDPNLLFKDTLGAFQIGDIVKISKIKK